MVKISVVVNTLNEEKNIKRAIESISWVDEVLVCDMYSEDKTVEIAKKLGAKVVLHKKTGFVEPARNFAISKTSNDWVLILDADEEVPSKLAEKLREISEQAQVDFVEIPRKNIIFDKWMQASMWWPDYNVRFFKKGSVIWSDKIHIPPTTSGRGLKLESEAEMAIIHYHYMNVFQYLERLNRYTDVQAKELVKDGYKFNWQDLIRKPLGEFLGRYFANRGFNDGLHGISLSLLQAFSFLIVYLKIWEMEKFTQQSIDLSEVRKVSKDGGKEIDYWFKYGNLSKNPVKRFIQKVRNRFP